MNGTQATFPNNPQGFGNAIGTGWTFQWVFTIPGTYNYQCDPHAGMGMTGIIIANAMSVPGCTDSTASNYNYLATVDYGYFVYKNVKLYLQCILLIQDASSGNV